MADDLNPVTPDSGAGLEGALGVAPVITATPASTAGILNPPQPAQPPAPDPLPKFHRTMGATLRAMLLSIPGGVPGIAEAAVDPGAVLQGQANRRAIAAAQVSEAQSKASFASAQAAHEA